LELLNPALPSIPTTDVRAEGANAAPIAGRRAITRALEYFIFLFF
jgi:hypothetical protein